MVNNLRSGEQRQEKKTRAWSKCSNCRQRKIKCEPQDRDWEGKKQKCDFCDAHSLPCSQNYKNKDDPARGRAANGQLLLTGNSSSQLSANGAEEDAQEGAGDGGEAEASTARRMHNDTIAPTNESNEQDMKRSSLAAISPSQDRRARLVALTDGALKAKALSKLERLGILGVASIYWSQTAPVLCTVAGSAQDYNYMSQNIGSMVKEEMHSLFINIYELGAQADRRGRHGDAQEIFLKMQLALERYPGLCDNRKRGALMKMAFFFQNREDHCESEHIMGKVADMHGASACPLYENPCPLLAESFSKTSEKARQILANLWQKTYGCDDVPANLTIPPMHRAAQRCNGDITASILSSASGYYNGPAMFEQQALHVAATQGFLSTVNQLLLAGALVDARDLHSRTPLFLAASCGHEQCCFALLMSQADPNVRDSHGHTVLEFAALGGYLTIVQQLVNFGAQVNPTLAYCASTPLQAAIESAQFNQEVALCLLDNDAKISATRIFDGGTAIQLAEGRGFTALAETMRQRELYLESQSVQSQANLLGHTYSPELDLGGYNYSPSFS